MPKTKELAFMMLDADVVAVSPSSVYRVLREAGVMDRFNGKKSIDDARAEVSRYVKHYNEVRLHSAIGYVTPHTQLAGEEEEVFSSRDRKLEGAREARRLRRQQQAA
jgi:hypothetical protein